MMGALMGGEGSMRGHAKLSKRRIETAGVGRHSDGGGLYLLVDTAGNRRWIWRYWQGPRKGGKLSELGLGPLRDVSAAAARELARLMREAVATGRDPRGVRQAPGAAPTFGSIADHYIETMRPSWRGAKHAAQWEMTMRVYAGPLRARPVNAIVVADVLAVLRPIWTRIPETAGRVRGRIELVLDAATAAGHRTGENPARWRGNLKHLLPPPAKLVRGHLAAVPYHEVRDLVARLRALESVSARCLEFAILTAARTREAIGCRWDEIDLSARVWTVPAARMKGKREHRVPLSDRAISILAGLEAIRTTASYVFPGQRRGQPLSDMAMTMCLRGLRPGFTVHGFRSTFRDWAGDCTTIQREIIEAALAHVIGDKAEQAYRRGDALERRRELMDAWCRYLDDAEAGNVIMLRG